MRREETADKDRQKEANRWKWFIRQETQLGVVEITGSGTQKRRRKARRECRAWGEWVGGGCGNEDEGVERLSRRSCPGLGRWGRLRKELSREGYEVGEQARESKVWETVISREKRPGLEAQSTREERWEANRLPGWSGRTTGVGGGQRTGRGGEAGWGRRANRAGAEDRVEGKEDKLAWTRKEAQ